MLVTIREQRYVSEPIETKYLNLRNKSNLMHYVHLDAQLYRDARSTKHTKVLKILTVNSIKE
jgi:hypothetical protein